MRQIIAFLLAGFTLSQAGAQELVFSNIEKQPISAAAAAIMTELYRKLGIEIEIKEESPARAAADSTSGLTDGEIGRIVSFNAAAPQLIRVPTPFYTGDTVAFARKDQNIKLEGADSLKNLEVARIRGVINSTAVTQNAEEISEFADLETMFKFLSLGRSDIAVTNRIGGMIVLAKLGFHDIIPLDPPLDTRDFYHFINVRHQELVPRIDALIREMKASGELTDLTQEVEKKIMQGEIGY